MLNKCVNKRTMNKESKNNQMVVIEWMKIIIIISQGLRNLGFPGSSGGKESVCQCRRRVWSLGWEDPLK